MKQKRMTIIAVACGVVCAACVAIFMMSVQGEAEAARAEALARYGGEQVEAYVATRDIVARERVDLSAVETKLWVADFLPEKAVRAASDVVGKTATSAIYKGEVITTGRFESERDSIDVPSGTQAVSVPAKAVQAVGGAIRAGMSVDIYSSGDSTTTALAQNVSVLDTSVGNSGSMVSSDNGWVTLAVEPEKVQELIAASNRTTLYFTLPGEPVQSGDADSEKNAGKSEGKGENESSSSASAASSSSSSTSTSSSSSASASSSSSSSKLASGTSASSAVEGGDRR
ncbi:MAG: Flp pilus assembly protein CpaB [Eggerthellaceae bacterium]|nr:Flp pilus assembly protein CpaB [Eggerthellaceae bacterium]